MDPTPIAYSLLFGEGGEAERIEEALAKHSAATKIQATVRGSSERAVAKIQAIQRERRARRVRKGQRGVIFNRNVRISGLDGEFKGQNIGRKAQYRSRKKTSLRWTADIDKEPNIYDVCEATSTTLPGKSFPHLSNRLKRHPVQILETKTNGNYVIATKINTQTEELERIVISEIKPHEMKSIIEEKEKIERGSSRDLFQAHTRIERGGITEVDTLYRKFNKKLSKGYLKDTKSIATDTQEPPFLALERYTDQGKQSVRSVVVVDKRPYIYGGFEYLVLRESSSGEKYLEARCSSQLKKYREKFFTAGPSGKALSSFISKNLNAKVGLDFITRKTADYNDVKEYISVNCLRKRTQNNFSERFYKAETAGSSEHEIAHLRALLSTGEPYEYNQESDSSKAARVKGAEIARQNEKKTSALEEYLAAKLYDRKFADAQAKTPKTMTQIVQEANDKIRADKQSRMLAEIAIAEDSDESLVGATDSPLFGRNNQETRERPLGSPETKGASSSDYDSDDSPVVARTRNKIRVRLKKNDPNNPFLKHAIAQENLSDSDELSEYSSEDDL